MSIIPHSPQGLSPEQIQEYYSLLNEEITDYDCGTLCAPLNNGVPFCCSVKFAVPLLYKTEFSYLRSRSDLWHKWEPRNSRESKMSRSAGYDEIYCECKGASQCIREERSISCRTFPLEPYIDEKGVIAGLVFTEDFHAKDAEGNNISCPLKLRLDDIRPEYIKNSLAFWKELLRIPAEYSAYLASSRTMRRRAARTGVSAVVITTLL
jgi:hypothetical protein